MAIDQSKIVCPHCQSAGKVKAVVNPRKISKVKVGFGLATLGVSDAFTGITSKSKGTHLSCGNCGMNWTA